MKQRHAEYWSLWITLALLLVAAAVWAMVARAAPCPAATGTPTPPSINYINVAGIALVNVNNPWEGITDPSVRQMLGLGKKRHVGMDMIFCDDFARRGIQWSPCK